MQNRNKRIICHAYRNKFQDKKKSGRLVPALFKDISVEEALRMSGVTMVDVRSEKEYCGATIPGAINIPLLSNEERAEVGTAYKREGPDRAKRLALEIVAPKLTWMVNAYDRLVKGKRTILFCWRGGLRSQFAASVLASVGFSVYRITGGYKKYRQYVNAYLQKDFLPHRAVVLYGLTGVGKTRVIGLLADLGIPVLDLEGLACHRGSVFGKIGLPPSPTQKMFEAQIFNILQDSENAGIFVVECESRRIGNLLVPPSIIKAMGNGYRVLLYAPLELRVQRIEAEYASGGSKNILELQEAVEKLWKRLGKSKVAELCELLGQYKFKEVFSYLITRYYDPLYNYPDGPSDNFDLSVECSNLEEAAHKIAAFIKSLPEFRHGGKG